MKKCLNCGEFNEESSAFCTSCGTSDFESVASTVCPSCKAEVIAGADFCTSCGAKMPNASVADINRINSPAELDTFPCPYCGNDISVASVFCPYCGQEVNNFTTNRKVKRLVCPNCGRPNELNAKMCSYCFFDLKDAAVEEMTIVVKPKECDNVKLMQCVLTSPTDGEGKVICPICQAMNNFESDYCAKCGHSLKIDIPKKYCFVCGAENSADAKFCSNCKFQFESRSLGSYTWTCSCGFENESDSEFCSYCGKPRFGAVPKVHNKRK